MAGCLTKSQAEALLARVDEAPPALAEAIADAVEAVHGTRDVAALLTSQGRSIDAEAFLVHDQLALWSLAAELNERRSLTG